MVLEKILAEKREYVERIRKLFPGEKRKKSFSRKVVSLKNILDRERFSAIAEIKRSSPSAGRIRENIDTGKTAVEYRDSGAAAVSILTCEPLFNGSMKDLKDARNSVDIPLLMKDFIIDESQIYEGRLYGADAILLIMRILDDSDFVKLAGYAESVNLDILVEVHSRGELERALRLVENWNKKILGINNRNLETLETDLKATADLMKFVREYKITAISESGIRTREDVLKVRHTGVKGILVGESLLKSGSPGENLKNLLC